MKRIAVLFFALMIPVFSGIAQDAQVPANQNPAKDVQASGPAQTPLPSVTLREVIDAALSGSDSIRILEGNLDVGKAVHAENVAKNSFNLAGALSYGVGENYYDGKALETSQMQPSTPTVLSSILSKAAPLSVTPGIPESAQGSLTASGPLTSATMSAAQSIQPITSSTATKSNFSSLGVSVSQTIWNGYVGGTAQAAIDKSLLTLQGKQFTADSGKSSFLYQVKQAYYTMLSAQRTLAVRLTILDKQNQILNQMKAVYDLKQASLIDLKTAEVNARSAALDVESGRNDLRSARVKLANLVGLANDREFSVAEAEDPAVPVSTLEDAISTGLKQRTDLRQIDLNRKSNAVDLALTRGQNLPSVSVSGGVNYAYDWTTSKAAEQVNLGVKLGLPILDSGLADRTIAEKSTQDKVYETQSAQLRKSIASDITDAFNNVSLAMKRLDLAKLNAETVDAQFELTKTQNQYGTATNQDMMTAAVNDANAQASFALAKSNAQLAVLQLQNVMGY
jgi:outer membrane protein